MPMGQFLTPDTVPTDTICRQLQIPNGEEYLAIVNYALLELTRSWNYEQFGSATPEEVSQLFGKMFELFGTERCYVIGTMFPFANYYVPVNSLNCDGTTYARVDYPALYETLDTVFIVDDDYFMVPDMRGRFLLGRNENEAGRLFTNVGDVGGEEQHTLQLDEMPSHVHGYQVNAISPLSGLEPVPEFGAQTNGSTDSSGSDNPHNNMPPYICLNWAIWAK